MRQLSSKELAALERKSNTRIKRKPNKTTPVAPAAEAPPPIIVPDNSEKVATQMKQAVDTIYQMNADQMNQVQQILQEIAGNRIKRMNVHRYEAGDRKDLIEYVEFI